MALVVDKTDSSVATEEQLALVAEYDALKSMESELKKELKKLQDRMVESLGEVNKAVKSDGRPLITLSPTSTAGKWDAAALKADGLEDKYWIPGGTITGTRLTVTL
jgi:hypothetical protein